VSTDNTPLRPPCPALGWGRGTNKLRQGRLLLPCMHQQGKPVLFLISVPCPQVIGPLVASWVLPSQILFCAAHHKALTKM
jgi:hypothetical protein